MKLCEKIGRMAAAAQEDWVAGSSAAGYVRGDGNEDRCATGHDWTRLDTTRHD